MPKRHLFRALCATLTTLLVIGLAGIPRPAAAITWYAKPCIGFDQCEDRGYGNGGYSAVYNNEATTQIVQDIAEELFPGKITQLPPMLGGEDFSAFSDIVPATYIWIGAGNAEKGYDYPHHHPKFALDEDSFLIGVKMFVAVAMNYSALAE